ncbi:MAG: cobalamin biosynthesis protein [Desulfarculus sp.]|nr:cobalamin biosynthesis protein [Desulfarculus sp.]
MTALPQPLAVYAITAVGAELARTLALSLPGAALFLPRALAYQPDGEEPFDRLTQALAANFHHFGGHVVLAAAGIVVRALAPLLKGKTQDPAVVVVDQAGRFAVSLLSGHLGGANALARRVAELLGGQAVITTATDTAGLPSLDMLAGELGLRVENLAALAKVSMSLLDGGQPAVLDPEGWLWPLLERRWPGRFQLLAPGQEDSLTEQPMIWVGWRRITPPPAWLVLRPPEAGLLELAARLGLPLTFYSTEELAAVEVPNPSATVAKHMGVASVCEAAALLAADSRRLLVSKQKSPNVTLAVALRSPGDGSTS